MPEPTTKPGDGSTNPFGAGQTGDSNVPGSLKGATDGESHESPGGKLIGLKEPNPGGAGTASRFKP